MKVLHSSKSRSLQLNLNLQNYLNLITKNDLINFVEEISIPRHFTYNSKNNKYVADWIVSQLESFGFKTELQGKYSNIIALHPKNKTTEVILIGAHYDSVPNCPGADDNASAVASMLCCAKAISEISPSIPICFVVFNCEEDGLIGSFDFVSNYVAENDLKIKKAHILEMIGYATDEPNSQVLPSNFPIKIPTTGNFLGIMGNKDSLVLVDDILAMNKTYLPEFSVIGLKIYLGAEKLFPDLGRSDHLPFWENKIPSVMWTDTAEFRNPNYHKLSDTPETLNYTFLQTVTQLLLLQILNEFEILN